MVTRILPSGQMAVEIAPQVSTATGGGVQISDNVHAPVFQISQLQFRANVQPGRPFVATNTNGGTLDSDGNAVMYVWRVTLGIPEDATP
jgi:hypothetical protein